MGKCLKGLLSILVLTVFISGVSFATNEMTMTYHVTIDEPSTGVVSVELKVDNVKDDLVSFRFGNMRSGPVENLKVVNQNGNVLDYKLIKGPEEQLDINTSRAKAISISYKIDTHKQYSGSHKGYIGEELAMLKGENILLFPAKALEFDNKTTKFQFITPKYENQFVPWQVEGAYYLPNAEILPIDYDYINNYKRASFAFGDFQSVKRKIGETNVEIVLPSKWNNIYKRNTIMNTFDLMAYYTDLFEDSIGQEYMLILMPPGPGNRDIQAGEWTSSQGLGVMLDDYNLERMAHQLFHRWNGFALGWDWNGELRDFLGEGLNRYYEAKSLLELKGQLKGLTYHNLHYLEALEDDYYKQKKADPDLSYYKAGQNGNNFIVYNGGAYICYALDAQIVKDTDGAYSLDHVIRAFHHACVDKKGQMTKAHFVKIAKEVTGIDYTSFLDKYVFGTEILEPVTMPSH